MAEPNPMRWVVLTFVAAGVFILGLLAFIDHTFEQAKAKAKIAVEADIRRMETHGTPSLDRAAAVAGPFVAHVGAGEFAEAHALLAAPYRQAVSVAAFAKSCRAIAILAGARWVTLRQLRRQNVGGASTLEASGLLDSSAGAVPAGFVFLEEAAGPRILVVSLAGVPVLQGVAPAR
jgi:hypothetical protein